MILWAYLPAVVQFQLYIKSEISEHLKQLKVRQHFNSVMEIDALFKYLLLLVFKFLALLLDVLLDALFGYSTKKGTREEQLKALDYEYSAQYVKVVWRAKTSIFSQTNSEDFLYQHVKYVHPDYILQNKNVTLFDIGKDYALFCVTDPDVDINCTEKFPFLFLSQYLEAKYLIILPIKSFHRLADEVGDPQVPVGLVHMTARSGSTLTTQMLSRVPGTRALGENWATCRVATLRYRNKITSEESKRLLRSGIRLHCKISPGEHVERVFFKLTVFNGAQFKDLKEIFPDFCYIFNARLPISSLKSFWQAFQVLENTLDYKLGIYWKTTVKDNNLFLPFDNNNSDVLAENSTWLPTVGVDKIGTIFYGGSMLCYLKNKDIYDYILLYEDLADHPEVVMKDIFQLMNIPLEHVPKALSALEKDSQNSTFGKRGKGRSYQLSQEVLNYFDGYMKKLGVPIKHDITLKDFRQILEK